MSVEDKIAYVLARMQINLRRGRGIRLSNRDLQVLSLSSFGEAMTEAAEEMSKPAPKVNQSMEPRP